MSFTFCQCLVFSCFTVTLLMGRVMTSPEVRQKRSNDGGSLEDVVEQLSQQVNTLNAKMAALETKTATLDETVVFQAWNGYNASQVAAGGVIILSDVVINVGKGYSQVTGAFTVPVSGIYNFQATIVSDKIGSGHHAYGAFFVDGRHHVATALSDSGHGYLVQATMNYVGHLNAGQTVVLKNHRSCRRISWFARNSLHFFLWVPRQGRLICLPLVQSRW